MKLKAKQRAFLWLLLFSHRVRVLQSSRQLHFNQNPNQIALKLSIRNIYTPQRGGTGGITVKPLSYWRGVCVVLYVFNAPRSPPESHSSNGKRKLKWRSQLPGPESHNQRQPITVAFCEMKAWANAETVTLHTYFSSSPFHQRIFSLPYEAI